MTYEDADKMSLDVLVHKRSIAHQHLVHVQREIDAMDIAIEQKAKRYRKRGELTKVVYKFVKHKPTTIGDIMEGIYGTRTNQRYYHRVYETLTRWVKTGRVVKVGRGLYQRRALDK